MHVIQNTDSTPRVCNRRSFGTANVNPPEDDALEPVGILFTNGGAFSNERPVPLARQDVVRKAFIQKSKLPISEYRLAKTFEASKTSYRILMFLNLFRRTAVGTSVPRKSIQQLRDNAFERHGAPAPGGAKYLADSIKEIHSVDNFGDFFTVMGMPDMGKEWFTKFLREDYRCYREGILW